MITMNSKMARHRAVGLFALVRSSQSVDRRVVRLPRRVPCLPLKEDTKIKRTNLKQTSVAKPRKWFHFRDQPPSSRRRGTTASHRRWRLHLREFAKNSRSFNGCRTNGSCVDLVFFPRKSASRNSTGIRCADTPSTKGDQRL